MQSRIGSSGQIDLCLVRTVHQTQNFQGMFEVLQLYFYFDQQGGGVSKTFKKPKVFEFCC